MSSPIKSFRVFIAVNLPKEVRDVLHNIEKKIQGSFPNGAGTCTDKGSRGVAKWVKPENLHITLLFIGEVREDKLEEIYKKVEQAVVGVEPFKIQLKKVCYGAGSTCADKGSRGVPRVIWVETEENKNLENIAQRLGNQRFNGHITLARVKQWVWKQIEPEEQPNIEQNLDIEFKAKSIEVMQSILKPKGPEYNILKSFQFEN